MADKGGFFALCFSALSLPRIPLVSHALGIDDPRVSYDYLGSWPTADDVGFEKDIKGTKVENPVQDV